MQQGYTTYARENGGRVILLFLLFLLAIYEFVTAGFNAYAIVCIIPFLILFVYIAFKWRMFTFWLLIVVNFFIQFKNLPPLPIPTSLPNEMIQLLLLGIAVIDARQTPHFERAQNLMFIALCIWCSFCTLEVLNDSCNLGIDVGSWYSGARMMAFQLLYIYLVFIIYITCPETLIKYLKLWAILALISAIWTWKQQKFGFTAAENDFIQGRGKATHIIQGGSLIRYFSTFSDAANYGCFAAASALSFIIFAITTRIKKDRYFFFLISLFVIKEMFASGTRTAIFCMIAGFAVYIFLSKSFKIAIPATIIGSILLFILVFTDIGNGSQQIRRMRSAFNKEDASSNVREINQATMKKYIKDAPWGIGIGMGMDNVPANNKFRILATIPPDSEYIFIWLRTGPVGITVFICTMLMMFLGACSIVFFKLRSPSLIGIGAGLCSSFVAIQLGGYANQVLMQFPNCLTFYGGLAIVYILPYIEDDWIKYEEERLAKQEKKKRIKLEKKLASRV